MRALLIAAVALSLPLTASAQDGPRSIAFVQAPEQATAIALGDTVESAMAEAVDSCVKQGGYPEDCQVTAACSSAGWSIDIFAQHQEGLHWHEFQCGLPSPEVARAVAAAICHRPDRPYLIECALVQLYDPSGAPQM